MTLIISTRRVFAWSLLAAVGCAKVTTIGVSAHPSEVGDASTAPEAASSPKTSTTIVAAQRGMTLQAYSPALGDVDGDGLDDFMLSSVGVVPSTLTLGNTPHLFYGRARFPEQLSTADADATFESGASEAFALGDVNGDGFADMVFGDDSGSEIVFGSANRFSGHHPKLSTGLQWRYVASVAAAVTIPARLEFRRVGDVNGDHKDDFLVSAVEFAPVSSNGWASQLTDYLVEGRSDGWPSGDWEPSWAAAMFGDEPAQGTTIVQRLMVTDSGDYDGDGYTDIIASGVGTSFYVFYGGPDGLHGVLTRDNADAELDWGTNWQSSPFDIGDLDGDGIDDLATSGLNELNITYGSSRRWSGVVTPIPDLTFFDQAPYDSAIVGDLDADGKPDLLVRANREIAHFKDALSIPETVSVLYQVQGTAKRLTGRHQLDVSQIYHPVGYALPSELESSYYAPALTGDVDGDGTSDLIATTLPETAGSDSTNNVYLLPGTMRDPD